MEIRRDEANLVLSINGQQAGTTLRDLESRARDLKRQLSRLPVDSDDFKKVAAELKGVNQQLLSVREQTKAVSAAMSEATTQTGGFRSVMQGVLSVFGGLNLQAVVQQLFAFAGRIFDIATGLDGFRQKTQTVFGEATSIVNGFAETNARSLGLARQEYINLATSAGDLIKPMGFTEEATAKLSVALVDQAGVLAQWSKGKVDSTQAAEILQKALLGERDALNTLGIDIKDSLIQDELKAKGLDKLTGESRRQAEAMITLEQITKQSASANEAFAENTDKLGRAKAELRAKVQEAFQVLAERFLPIINRVASVIGPLVNWIGQFVVRLVQLADRAKVFNYLSATFNALGTVVSNVIGSLGSLADGLVSLFEGDFGRAWEKFKSGTSDLFSTGFRASESFIEGWKSKDPLAFLDEQGGAFEASGNNVGKAFNNGFDAEFEKLKRSGTQKAEDLAKVQKAALEAALKGVEVSSGKEILVLEKAHLDKKVNESEFARQMLVLQQQQYLQQLAAYRKYGQDQTREAVEIQRKLLEVQGQLNRPNAAPVAALPTRGLPGSVKSEDRGALVNAETQVILGALQQRFTQTFQAEFQYEEALARTRVEQAQRRLQLLQNANLTETQEYQKALDEKIKADEEFNRVKTENVVKQIEFERQMQDLRTGTVRDGIGAAIQLLSTDEKARKKHGAVIKALEIANVGVNLAAEISSIRRWAAAQALNAVIPGWAQVYSAVQIGIAVAQAAAQTAKIAKSKFAGGGYTGNGSGRADETGHVPVGVVHAREWVGPRWMAEHPVYGRYINALEGIRRRGYADGGYTTTPTLSLLPGIGGGSTDSVMMGLMATVGELKDVVRGFPRELRARVAYTEIEDVGKVLGDVRNEAAL